MEITELKNWFMSMLKPTGLDSKPSDEPIKMEGLLNRKDYMGVAFGALCITAMLLFLSGFAGLIKDAFADPEGFSNTMAVLMILIGGGSYFYALKFKPNSRYWGEIGTYSLVIFFTAGFMLLGTTMEWWEKPKTGIFILLFLYIPVLYLRKNVLGGLVYAGLLLSYIGAASAVSPILSLAGARGVMGYIAGGEFTSFWFWFFFMAFIPYFTLSFKENFRPGIESILLGYSFSALLLYGVSSALGSHQMFGLLLASSLLYLIGNIVYKHNYIVFKPFQVVSVIIFIGIGYAMMNKGSMMGLYGASGYMSFVNSILKEWTAYIVILVLAVAAFMVFMIWKSEYVDNDRRANVFAIVLPFYFLLMAPFVNWGLEDIVVLLNIVVIMALSVMVIHYGLKDNKWYNVVWAPILTVSGMVMLGAELDAGAKFNSFMLIAGAGFLGGLVMKYIPKIGETVTPADGDVSVETAPSTPTPTPAPEVKEEPKAEAPAAEESNETSEEGEDKAE
ncbi:MAG: hypothetical protein KDC84_07365 [Crocinitomicaceae bacterium]|nr:hypothetical protein [Crocinitomicaceae bacterium]